MRGFLKENLERLELGVTLGTGVPRAGIIDIKNS